MGNSPHKVASPPDASDTTAPRVDLAADAVADPAVNPVVSPAVSPAVNPVINMDQWCVAANDDSVQCFLKSTLQTMISDNTRELHLEEDTDISRVRIRVNGRLTERKIDNPTLASELLASLYKIYRSVGADTSVNEDFGELQVPVQIDGKKLDLRINHYKTVAGKSLTLLFGDAASIPDVLEQTDLDPDTKQKLRQHYKAIEAKGITLICSHSTESLRSVFYALLGEVNTVERKIVALQHRNEKGVPRVSQIQTGHLLRPASASMTSHELCAVLSTGASLSDHVFIDWETTRDPRFAETIQSISQKHTSITLLWHGDAATGLLNLIAPTNSLRLGLDSIIELQDTGLICPHCAEVYVPGKLDLAHLPATTTKDDPPESYFYADGCSRCDETGISSMATLSSFATSSDELRQAMESGSLTATNAAIAKAQGKSAIRVQSERLARSGKISLEDWVKGKNG
jgi:type II secretory ATPase GspE/PulE/Tfp pilus assembly ATPase PilB-like protein